MVHRLFRNPRITVSALVLLSLALIIACGGAAATPIVVEKEVIKEVIKEVVVEKEVIKEVIKEIIVISSSEAGEHMGEESTVRGSVVDYNYRQSAKGRPYILIFDNPGIISQLPFHLRGDLEAPITFQVVIFKDDHKNFPPNFAVEYQGHTVCATGTIVDYKGAPAIEAHDPSQLEIDC